MYNKYFLAIKNLSFLKRFALMKYYFDPNFAIFNWKYRSDFYTDFKNKSTEGEFLV